MSHLIQRTFTIERKNGFLNSESPFPSCEIAKRLTPLQKTLLAEHIIRHYLLHMEREIKTEGENDSAQDESRLYRLALEQAGVRIQIIEKI